MATAGGNEMEHSDQSGSEDLSEISCEPCQTKGRLETAVGLCLDCQEYLCEKCYNVHTIPTALQNHALIDKEKMLQSRVSLIRKDECNHKCVEHKDKAIEYYCHSHGQLGCGVCITLNHRVCDKVTYIPHAAKDLVNSEEYQQAESKFKSVFKRSNQIYDITKLQVKSLEEDYSNVVKMIQDFRLEINVALDQMEADIIEKAKTVTLDEIKKVEDIAKMFISAHSELQATTQQLKQLQTNQQLCNLYTVMMKTKNRLQFLENEVLKTEREQSLINDRITFEPTRDILLTLRNYHALGKLSKLSKTQTHGILSEAGNGNAIVQLKQENDIQVKFVDDEEYCWITGSSILPDSRLVMTDYNNSSLKLVGISHGKQITKLVMSSSPWDVTVTNINQVAVTLPFKKTIAIVSLNASTMKLCKTFPVSGSCHGLTYGDGKLAVTLFDRKEVQVLDLQGSVLHSIVTDNNGCPIFSQPSYVTFGKDKTTVYVSHAGTSSSVVCVKFDGTVVATYKDSKLGKPRGLAVDNKGNVFICATDANCIHQISPDCRTVRIEARGLFKPYSISYSETDHTFYVGMWQSRQCNYIKIYSATFHSD